MLFQLIIFLLRAQKVTSHRTIDWKMNLTGHCQRVHLFSIVTSWKKYFSCKKNYLLWRFVLDGSWPWHILYIKRREEKQAVKEGKCFSTTITYIFSSEVSLFWVGAGGMNLYISCPLWSFQTNFLLLKQKQKRCCSVYVYKAPYNWLPEQMTAPRSLSSNYRYVFPLCEPKELRKCFNSLKKT